MRCKTKQRKGSRPDKILGYRRITANENSPGIRRNPGEMNDHQREQSRRQNSAYRHRNYEGRFRKRRRPSLLNQRRCGVRWFLPSVFRSERFASTTDVYGRFWIIRGAYAGPTPGNVCNSCAVARLIFRTREPLVKRSLFPVFEQYCATNANKRMAPARKINTCLHLICGALSISRRM
jgi:hypothetical protein